MTDVTPAKEPDNQPKDPQPAVEKLQAPDMDKIKLAMAAIDKQYGKGTVVRVGDKSIVPVNSISTGAMSLDVALGLGGLPKGRIIEIYGPESSSKSTLCLSVIAEAQKKGGICVLIDTEHSIDPNYAKRVGVNMEDLLFSQPTYGEMAIETAIKLIRTGQIAVVVIDSVANLVPKAELEGDFSDNHVGRLPRLMAKAMRVLTAEANNTGTLVIFTNQIREKVGVMFGSPETTPGGRALKFYASVRIDLRKIDKIVDKSTGEVSGFRIKAKIPKNKVGPAFRECEYEIFFDKGIDRVGSIVEAGLDTGILTKGGGGHWISYDAKSIGNGKPQTISALESDPTLLNEIYLAICKKVF